MAKTQVREVLVSAVSKPAGTVTRGRWDVSALDGGVLTVAITNGGTGPTVQATANILIAHKQATMPAAAGESSGEGDWKRVATIGGGITAGARTPLTWTFGPEVAYVEVEFAAHTGSDVIVEAIGTGYSY